MNQMRAFGALILLLALPVEAGQTTTSTTQHSSAQAESIDQGYARYWG